MEFDEMKKIWDSQNNEALYAINESALHNRIQAKKESTKRTTSFVESILIGSNLCAGALVIVSHIIKNSGNVAAFAMGIMMALVGAYLAFLRARRIKRDQQTDASMLGDLENAIENINYRLKLSYSMLWYVIVVASFSIYTVWDSGKSLGMLLLVSAFFIVGFFLSRWEYRKVHVGRKKHLLALKSKLMNEFEIE